MIWLLFGAPGSGKGTQSKNIQLEFGYYHLSTGDMFRKHLKEGTPLGLKAQGFIKDGNLVPDEITIGMVNEELKTDKPTILDGFPRTLEQGKGLELLLEEKSLKMGGVIFLDVPHEELMDRLTGRRVCKKCGEVYHVKFKPSKVEGVCDVCGGDVVHRPDDQEDVIDNRLSVFSEQTEPLLNYYDEKGLLFRVDGMGGSSDVFSRVEEILRKSLS